MIPQRVNLGFGQLTLIGAEEILIVSDKLQDALAQPRQDITGGPILGVEDLNVALGRQIPQGVKVVVPDNVKIRQPVAFGCRWPRAKRPFRSRWHRSLRIHGHASSNGQTHGRTSIQLGGKYRKTNETRTEHPGKRQSQAHG